VVGGATGPGEISLSGFFQEKQLLVLKSCHVFYGLEFPPRGGASPVLKLVRFETTENDHQSL